MNKTLTLYELNSLVSSLIDIDLPDCYWVVAELSEIREVRGHCYMELVEKDDVSNTPVARASAKCWASRWSVLRPMFERVAGQRLSVGMKVLIKVKAQFHPAYGFSWIVTDLNPEYTMGDLARRRQEIVRQLKSEGVFDLQRELQLPLFAQRIAVVSSENAAGYGDFCRQLHDNSYGYAFSVRLFCAVMQGEAVEKSVISALNSIYEDCNSFDCVVIIRGGGATSDLSGFDTLALAENVANFPLPIITGIGHERDESVLDMIAYAKVKTPTAAAQLLVDNLAHTDSLVDSVRQRLSVVASRRMEREQIRLSSLAGRIPVLFSLVGVKQTAVIDRISARLSAAVAMRFADEQRQLDKVASCLREASSRRLLDESHRLSVLQQRIEAENPERLLKRGYSITTYNGHAIKDASLLESGAEVETRVEHGKFKSVVK